jgi:hypothetical protein
MGNESKSGTGSFWTTLPGILTGCGGLVGAIATLVGACYTVMVFLGGPASSPTASSPAANSSSSNPPSQISNSYAPNTEYIVVEKVRLPQENGVSQEVQQAVARLIVNADKAEILANFYQNDSYLQQYYTGDALRSRQQNIEQIRQSGYVLLEDFDLNRSYYTSMRLNNNILSIDECEYWKSYWYDRNTLKLVQESEWKLVPQTINIELVGNQAYITSISFYENRAFCTQ